MRIKHGQIKKTHLYEFAINSTYKNKNNQINLNIKKRAWNLDHPISANKNMQVKKNRSLSHMQTKGGYIIVWYMDMMHDAQLDPRIRKMENINQSIKKMYHWHKNMKHRNAYTDQTQNHSPTLVLIFAKIPNDQCKIYAQQPRDMHASPCMQTIRSSFDGRWANQWQY